MPIQKVEIHCQSFQRWISSGEIGTYCSRKDHHDVAGADSPFREAVLDGSMFTADMAVHNFVGDSFRGVTWLVCTMGAVGWASYQRWLGC